MFYNISIFKTIKLFGRGVETLLKPIVPENRCSHISFPPPLIILFKTVKKSLSILIKENARTEKFLHYSVKLERTKIQHVCDAVPWLKTLSSCELNQNFFFRSLCWWKPSQQTESILEMILQLQRVWVDHSKRLALSESNQSSTFHWLL